MTDTIVMRAEPVVSEMKKKISADIADLKHRGIFPKLVALLIGKDPVSRTYVDLKRKDCEDVGILSEVRDLSLPSKAKARETVISTIRTLNSDQSVSAIIPQMPFDGQASEEEVFSILSPKKDVDGLTPFNLGKLMRKEYSLESSLLPCTPKGIILLLKHYGVSVKGSEVAIVGRGLLVGEPLRKLFQDLNATATCYHTQSKNLKEMVGRADIIVAASGKPPEIYGESGFRLSGDMVKEGSTVISAGVRKDEKTGKMLFDVDTRSLNGKCSFLTPNTGGVGAMTRASLLANTVIASAESSA